MFGRGWAIGIGTNWNLLNCRLLINQPTPFFPIQIPFDQESALLYRLYPFLWRNCGLHLLCECEMLCHVGARLAWLMHAFVGLLLLYTLAQERNATDSLAALCGNPF